MRILSIVAFASLGVFGLTVAAAAQTSTVAKEPSRTVSVPKPAPQRLAPPEPQAAVAAPEQVEVSPPRRLTPQFRLPLAQPEAPIAAPGQADVSPPQPVPVRPAQPQAYAPAPPPAFARPMRASPEPQAAFSSPERLMNWISNYRDHKQPSLVPAAVHAMKDFGLFGDEEKAWFCTGFIAGVLGSNPKDGRGLIAKMFPMPDKEQAVIIRAIVYSGRPDWRELLEKYSPRMPLRRPLIDDFLTGRRPTLMQLKLEHGGSPAVYALWGYYAATGHHQPVVRIMQALRWSRTKGGGGFSFSKIFSGWSRDPSAIDKITAGGTAKWTLASYAERDRGLITLYRAEYGRQPQEIAKPLKDVIEAAEIFESEKIRKDQFGAIEDAQRQKLTSEAGMSKGATAGSIAIATGCVAATALAQAYIAIPCVIGGALYTGTMKLAH
jgi:hypothetical protein